MTDPHDTPTDRTEKGWLGAGTLTLVLGGLALLTPLARADVHGRVGLLLGTAALIELAHGIRRTTVEGQRAAWFGGALSLGMAALLIGSPLLAGRALVALLAGSFGLDGLRYVGAAARRAWRGQKPEAWAAAAGGNFLAAAGVYGLYRLSPSWALAAAGAVRIAGTAFNILAAPVFAADEAGRTVATDLALPDRPELNALSEQVAREEAARAAIDRGWVIGYLFTLLAIHVGRMGFDRSALRVLAPGFAVIGDVFTGLLLAFVVVLPAQLAWRHLTWRPERLAWDWLLAVPEARRGPLRRLAAVVLRHRLRGSVRLRRARYSLAAAVSRGLQVGLPLAAVVAATVPVWGMNWYFDTENWAAAVWNSWAEQRTDVWREAMARALAPGEGAADAGPAAVFGVRPEGVGPGSDFAFIVIGDTGEGDASQHSLRDAYLRVVRRDDVKFVVVSSDVIYPTGAMRDYEANFWLPFMGTEKPVYAIPGNHDWFDALEGFNATFLEPDAARKAIRARVAADHGLTSTTDAEAEALVAEASRLRREYRVPTQQQRAPFFQLQTDRFALIAVDTGVARRVDRVQLGWLVRALQAARGKTVLVLLGHPFFAGGLDQTAGDPDFAALRELLRANGAAVVMAGDTHDLEHYVEPGAGPAAGPLHHFVNGGGGAYLSFGTALDWPGRPVSDDWAFYPSRADVVAKIEATTPWWKTPAWWWTKKLGGWPFSAEWLSAAFDRNVAPYYQSFIEVRVEPSRGLVRFLPYGVHGRLRWADLDAAGSSRPAGAQADDPVEWSVPLAPPPPG